MIASMLATTPVTIGLILTLPRNTRPHRRQALLYAVGAPIVYYHLGVERRLDGVGGTVASAPLYTKVAYFPFTCCRKCSTSAVNCSGSCRDEKWLTSGCSKKPALGSSPAMNSVFSRLIASSWPASPIHTGTAMRRNSSAVQFGWVSPIFSIWAGEDFYSVGVCASL